MSVAVSVIVPVYNAERYLGECLRSLVHQSLQNIEIIIIDDGSTDGSRIIANEFAATDKRIVFISQSNQGVSAARNAGLAAARGCYAGFVDSDDLVDPFFYEHMVKLAENHDASLVVCSVNSFGVQQKPTSRINLEDSVIGISSENKTIIKNFLQFDYDYANWNKLYRLDIIRENHLWFDNKLSVWEDLLFNLQFLHYSNTIVTTKKALYHYRIHTESVMAARADLYLQYNRDQWL